MNERYYDIELDGVAYRLPSVTTIKACIKQLEQRIVKLEAICLKKDITK